MIGWQSWLGSLEVERKGDLVAIAGKNTPPYTDLIDATEADLIAVLIDGRPRLGRADILDPFATKMELVRWRQRIS
jgi:imidazolonepropionase-like amidohydrolase